MQVRIYHPTKTAPQSGHGKGKWVMEFVTPGSRFIEGKLHRTASDSMLNEVRMEFPDQGSAIKFAQSKDYDFEVLPFQERKLVKKSYASNFK